MKLIPDIHNITLFNKGTWNINDQANLNFIQPRILEAKVGAKTSP